MKIILQLFFFISSIVIICTSCKKDDSLKTKLEATESISSDSIQLSTWLYGKSSAISYTWDDVCLSQLSIISPLFDKHELNTSFFPIIENSNFRKKIFQYKDLIKNGHEVGCHTLSHPDLTTLNNSQLFHEIADAQDTIAKLFGYNFTTFIHPQSKTNAYIDSIIFKYYLFTRISQKKQTFDRLIIALTQQSTCKSMMKIYNDQVKGKNKWLIFAGHGVDNDGYAPLRSSSLDSTLTILKKEDVLIDSFKNIALYEDVRNNSQIIINDNSSFNIQYKNLEKIIFSKYNISILPITILIRSNKKLKFISNNILDVSYNKSSYLITCDLLKGASCSYVISE